MTMLEEVAKTPIRGKHRNRNYDSDEDEENIDRNGRRLTLESSDEEDGNGGKRPTNSSSQQARHRPPRPSAIRRSSMVPLSAARRRRSSARFLKLGGSGEESSSGGGGRAREHSRKSLALIYTTEIKMNAENRINSANSWNFKLIENLDRLLTSTEEEEGEDGNDPSNNNNTRNLPPRGPAEAKRVDFTRASCSIDASVRIYGYRVDDVHLTSYKVLANLHRSDTNNKKKGKKGGDDDEGGEGETGGGGNITTSTTRKKTAGPTLESSMANINLSKLDAAFDIDPLFHKMSKTFDEGGAKGLLLANLGTGGDGCNIIFDTPSNESEEEESLKSNGGKQDANQKTADATTLLNKLEVALDGLSANSFSLVSQLSGLRVEFAELEDGGFVDTQKPDSRTQRYAPEWEEEVEADKSIHQEALERSRISLGRSFAFSTDDRSSPRALSVDGGDYADDNYGDYGGGDGGFDDDFGVPLFLGDDGKRASSFSFAPVQTATQERQQTAALLDIISSGKLLGNSQYEYLDRQTLSQISNNAWAGAAHWQPAKKPKNVEQEPQEKQKDTEKKTRKCAKDRVFVDLASTPDMTDILRMPPKPKGKNRTDPLQFSSAVIAKHSSDDNTLPPDARLGVGVFSALFLRPNAVVKEASVHDGPNEVGKSVAWNMDRVETFGGGDWDDGSIGGGGDDNDGPGFDFGGDDEDHEFVPVGLEDVRRVQKIRIGYATVAKKVDVKRLKQDLWTEIGQQMHEAVDEKQEEDNMSADGEKKSLTTPSDLDEPLSFYNVVQKMEQEKKQADVSLPYYFICMLHLANERNLRLESQDLNDFLIYQD